MIQVDDQPVEWEEGMTLASLLAQLENTGFVSVVRLNGRLVSSPQFDRTPVPDHAVIRLLPIVAGG